MSADLAARLRALTQDYHEGRLNLAAYRALRGPLLDSLVAAVPSAADMEITRPRAARPVSSPPAESTAADTQPQSAQKGRGGIIAIVVAAVAVAGGVLWFVTKGTPPSQDVGPTSGEQVVAGPVHGVVVPFMERGDWSDAQLAPLNASLLEGGEYELGRVAREGWFQRFVDELRRRLKEQQALAAAPLTPDNSAIAALAVTVGFDLSSPDAAIHIASVEPPPAPPAEVHSSARSAKEVRPSAPKQPDTTEATGSLPPPTKASEETKSANAAAPATEGAPTADARGGANGGVITSVRSSAGASTGAALPVSTTAAASADAARDSACRIELIKSRRPLCSDPTPGGEGPLLALVPAGSFDMGSTAASEEQPLHKVAIPAPFAISVNEVSQSEFREFCQHTGRSCASQPWAGDDYPVVNVSWSDASAYAEWLSSVTRQRYRLPSEAQWEYAARAGQTGPFPGGDSLSPTDAHFSTSVKQSGPARRTEKFKANGFRLLHTLGNVREWVEDAWVPGYAGAPADGSAVKPTAAGSRVTRGGSYADGSARLRLSLREGLPENTRDPYTGFRVVREIP